MHLLSNHNHSKLHSAHRNHLLTVWYGINSCFRRESKLQNLHQLPIFRYKFLFYVKFTISFFLCQPFIVYFYKYYYLFQIVASCFGIFAQSLNSLTPQKISFPVHTQNARSALLSKGLRAFCIHVCNLFYQFRLNSASVRPGFFCSAQRMLHSLLKMSRLCPRKSCTHFVSEARLSAVGSVPSLVIQRM